MRTWSLPGTYRFRGHEVRYGMTGTGAPLVLIHGTPFSSYVWRRIVPCLALHRRVFFFDLLGYGQSDQRDVPDVSLGVQNHLLAELLDHWQLEQPDVLAHDFGGATALRCHFLNGREFRSLTLVDPVAMSPWGIGFDTQVRANEGVFRALPEPIHEAVVRAYIRGAYNRVLPETDLSEYIRPWIGEVGQAAFYRQMSQFDLRYTDEVEPLYANIRCPTLILWGEADQWLPIEGGYRLQKRIPSARFQAVPGSGHLMQEDAPEAIVGAVLRFLPEGAAS
jgi:pimeloyl-ACP methyl ester carboxylesterase